MMLGLGLGGRCFPTGMLKFSGQAGDSLFLSEDEVLTIPITKSSFFFSCAELGA